MRLGVPPNIRFHRSRVLRAAALVVGALLACESPFEPRGEGERVPIGQPITDAVTGDTVARYSFVAQGGGPYVVFLAAFRGAVQLSVRDSTSQNWVTFLSAGPGSPSLYQNATSTFPTQQGDVYQLEMNAVPAGSYARFGFVVYSINTSPELRSDVFAFGDTVAGETIDPIVDLDEFIVHGQAGQEFVAVAETPGPPGSGSVALSVVDPVTNYFLGYVFADAGSSNALTTGRLRLPATHDYRFTLGSVTSNQYPRYRGPYRFWTYLINRVPEHRAAPIPFDTEIGSERIDRAGDVDEFTFQATAGADFNAFVQAPRAVQLEVAPPIGPAFAVASSQSSDTALFAHATSRFQITQAGTYVVRVAGANPYQVADTGGYRFFLYAIDRRPEHVPQSIAPGDTVSGEDIGLPGDIDEFTFSGTAGEEFNAFLKAESGLQETFLQLEVVDPTGAVLRTTQSVGTDTSLLRQPTGRFALTSTGTYRLRVTTGSDLSRGPYRFFVYRVNRAPESVPAILAFGDSVSGEAMEVPGDVDEFRVRVPDSSGANLVFELETQPVGGSLTVQLIDSATGQVIVAGTAYSTGRGAMGSMRLAPGTYIVRADGNPYEDRSVMQGDYRLWFYRFGFGPEVAADTFAIGDTVSGESIEPWGDFDQFYFYGVRGQHVNALLQGLAAPSDGEFETVITPPGDPTAPPSIFIFSPKASAALEDHQTTRLDLPATGWYRFVVHGAGDGFAARGAYRFAVLPIGDTGPEHVSAALAVGDSVTTESIDTPGDWDEFTLTATPGRELYLIFRGKQGVDGPFPYVHLMDSTTGDTLAANVGQGEHVVGPFLVPAGGQAAIAVYQHGGFFRVCYDATCGSLFSFVGPYAVRVWSLNRGPELVPVTYVVGDTVRGEALWPAGDIDEFVVSATPGEQLTPFYRLTSATTPADGLITLQVVDPSTDSVLVGSNTGVLGTVFGTPGSFVVPASGTFVVRIRAFYAGDITTAPYEFYVSRP